jgi:hypothetical protein
MSYVAVKFEDIVGNTFRFTVNDGHVLTVTGQSGEFKMPARATRAQIFKLMEDITDVMLNNDFKQIKVDAEYD